MNTPSLLAVIAVCWMQPGASMAVAAPATATNPPSPPPSDERVAIVAQADDPLARAIAAEVQALGFSIAWVRRADAYALEAAALVSIAREVAAIAAIRARLADGRIEVWIADRVTSKTVLRVLEGDAERGSANLGIVALRSVELLRASLLEATLPDTVPGEVPSTTEIEDKAKLRAPPSANPSRPGRQQPVLRLSLAPLLTYSPGGLTAGGGVGLAGVWMPNERVGLVTFLSLSMLGSVVEKRSGRATLDTFLAGAALRLQPWGRGKRWVPSLDLGFAAVSLASGAEAKAPFQTQAVSAWTATGVAQLGVALAWTEYIRLRADVGVGLLLSPASLRFLGDEVATWGLPFIAVGIGADIAWFY